MTKITLQKLFRNLRGNTTPLPRKPVLSPDGKTVVHVSHGQVINWEKRMKKQK